MGKHKIYGVLKTFGCCGVQALSIRACLCDDPRMFGFGLLFAHCNHLLCLAACLFHPTFPQACRCLFGFCDKVCGLLLGVTVQCGGSFFDV